MKHRIQGRTRGFTLIELLVVIAIIGLLSSVVLAALNSARASARDAKRLSDGKQLVNALELYATNNGGQYPAGSATGGTCGPGWCMDVPTNVTALAPYLPTMPVDPLPGNTGYRYRPSVGNTKYEIVMLLEGSGWCIMRSGSLPVNGTWVVNGAPVNSNYDWCE